MIIGWTRYQYGWTNFSGLLVFLLFGWSIADAVLDVCPGILAFNVGIHHIVIPYYVIPF
jgi:hypothetical protein